MAELSPQAQEVILCEECEESPAQHHCLTCAGHLCGPCKDAHGRKKISRSHKIVLLTTDLPVYGNCVGHPQCKYEVFCKNCDVPICMECMMKGHNGDKIEDMQKVYERKKQFILQEISKLENDLIPKEKKDLESTKNEITEMKQATDRMRKDMEDQCEKLIDHIRKLLKKSLEVVDNIEHSKLEDLRSQVQKSEEKISKYKDIKADLERKSTIRIVTDFLNSTKHMSAIPPHDTSKTSYTLPSFAPAVVENITINHHFGLVIPPIIQDVRKKLSPNLHMVKEIHTNFWKMCGLKCNDDSTVWVRSDDSKVVMQHSDGNKNVNSTLFCSSRPWGLYIDGNCAFYSDYENKQITRIISTDWNPSGLHICKSGDILVCLINKKAGKGNAKVVKYTGNGNVIFETTQDNQFHYPLYIAENINLDVCVSDTHWKKIIVLNSAGDLKFQYDGNLKGQYSRSFFPKELVTDSLGNIIVADEWNSRLHVISKDGDFLLHLETYDVSTNLSSPCGLSIDVKGRLWLAERESRKIKVFEYIPELLK